MKDYRVYFDQINGTSFVVKAKTEESARKKGLKHYKQYLLDTIDDIEENGELTIEGWTIVYL